MLRGHSGGPGKWTSRPLAPRTAPWPTSAPSATGSNPLPTPGSSPPAAFGIYRPSGDGTHRPFSLQVIETSGGRIIGLHNFLFAELFPTFGLPVRLG